MKYPYLLAALAALATLAGVPARADNMASIAIAPATGAVTLVPRWSIGGNLAGFHFMAQDLSLTGGAANEFYSIKNTGIPAGGDISAFSFYVPGSGAATSHADIGSKLTPNSYSALTSADPDLGYGSVQFYLIHHKTDGDYFTHIVPSSAIASAVADLKPMSRPGGPATGGASGYFGLTFAASNLGYGLNLFYYLRNDPVTGHAKFGTLSPALAGASADQFDLGANGANALAFTGTDVGFGVNQMYFQRLDPVTGFTILSTLNPTSGRAADIANLGSVYSTLTYVPGDVGFGSSLFYTTGTVNTTWQSVSFAAIADRALTAGAFTVKPSASSNLPIALTVVPGSTGAATIAGPVAGVFTVTPIAPGVITLQATQSGSPGQFEFNMLRQSFTVTGVSAPVITNSPLTAAATVGSLFSFTITAAGAPTTYSATPLPAGLSIVAATGVISGTPTTVGTTSVLIGATNVNGTGNATLTITVAAVGSAPIITNTPLSAGGAVGTAFSYAITASNSPTSYTASPLPAGLSVVAATGVITGTPTTVGTTLVLLGATNSSGTGNATLTITVSAAGAAPSITNNPLTAAGTVGTPFSFLVTASGLPTSYGASPLPAGLVIVGATGAITGIPTTAGTTVVQISATNGAGTDSAALVITIAGPAVAPIITNNALTPAGTVGVPFSFTIVASGTPSSYSATGLPAGLTLNPATGVITGLPTTSGTSTVTLTATNSAGTSTVVITIKVALATVAPVITSAPTATGTAGAPFVTYVIAATGLPTSYTATGLPAGLTLNSLTGAINGTPTVTGTFVVTVNATNAAGTSTATLTLTISAAPFSRIVNFSARALSGPGDQGLITGFIVLGNSKNVLVRGVGPGLAQFGFVNFLADPLLSLYNSDGSFVTNDDWQTNAQGQIDGTLIASTSARVGAFAMASGSKDSALLAVFNDGAHTTSMGRPNGTTGVALAEVYDTDLSSTSRLINVSARVKVVPGDSGTLIAGLVIAGNTPKTVLIRGVGPSLAAFGVAGTLADPQISVFAGATALASNDNWEVNTTGTPAQISAVSAQVGAFPLAAGSKDAALLLTLQPGVYTVLATGVGNSSGVALVEVYDVQ